MSLLRNTCVQHLPDDFLPREEVKHIAERRRICAIDLRIATTRAGHGAEFLVLHVKNFGESSASRPKLVGFEIFVAALNALPVYVLHGVAPGLSRLVY
jgi:hypothetical protein